MFFFGMTGNEARKEKEWQVAETDRKIIVHQLHYITLSYHSLLFFAEILKKMFIQDRLERWTNFCVDASDAIPMFLDTRYHR